MRTDEGKRAGKQHPPVVKGECGACHVPHASERAPLLAQREESLCLACHRGMVEKLSAGKLHNPFAGGNCSQCHVSHGTQKQHLKADDASICLECHVGARKARAASVRSRHICAMPSSIF